jgi:dTDP-glucose pyrophosphorylase
VGKYVKPLAMVLAGGKGERLFPLTRHRTKPAVHFGGIYRLIDFVLSNLVNSGIYSIYVLTQYKAQSLLRHLQLGWVGAYPMNSFFILPVPAQMRMRETWYLGTADAIYQNIYLIKQFKPDIVLVFSADHVYFMNVRQMIEYHLAKGADVTVATIQFPISECSRFGVVSIDENWQIIAENFGLDNSELAPFVMSAYNAGSDHISKGLREYREEHRKHKLHFYRNFSPEDYGVLIDNCACLIGNSSSAIREGSFLGVPAVDIGTRQEGRERAENVIHVDYDRTAIREAVKKQIAHGKYDRSTLYGDGRAGERIAEILANAEIKIQKKLAY